MVVESKLNNLFLKRKRFLRRELEAAAGAKPFGHGPERFLEEGGRTTPVGVGESRSVRRLADAGCERSPTQQASPRKTDAERQEELAFFTEDELRRMYVTLSAKFPDARNASLVFAHTGCRAAEVRGIRPEDLEPERQMVWVTGDGGRQRPMTLTGDIQPAWGAIQDEMRERPRADGFVFPQSATWAWKMIDSIAERAFHGRKHGHPHTLRHAFATNALPRWEWEATLVSKWLGHESVITTCAWRGHLVPRDPPSGCRPNGSDRVPRLQRRV